MVFFRYLFCVVVVLVLVVQPSLQCTCDWGWKVVEGEFVPNTLCYDDGEFIEFKVDTKEQISGPSGYDDMDGQVQFNVTVSKYITKAAGEEALPGGRKVTLVAPTASSMCGYINYPIDSTNVMSSYGGLQDKMSFNACHFSRRKSEVTDVQRRLMSGELSCPTQ